MTTPIKHNSRRLFLAILAAAALSTSAAPAQSESVPDYGITCSDAHLAYAAWLEEGN